MITVIKISTVSSIKQKEGTIVRLKKRSLPIYIYAQERCSYKIVVWYAWCRFHLQCFSFIINNTAVKKPPNFF